MRHVVKHDTLYEAFFKYRNILTDVFLMMLSVVVMAVLANVRVPLWPVPITMQTFGVFLIAFFFGSRKGLVAMLLYLVVGLLGFGVFTGYKSGYSAFIGSTGGYLIGFLVAVFLVGYLVEKGFGKSKVKVIYAMMAGNAVIYLFGLVGLGFYLDVGVWKLLMLGLFPFLIGDALKIVVAMQLFPYLFSGKI